MYFCKNCGRLAHPGEDRCPKCGAAHIQPTPAAAAPTRLARAYLVRTLIIAVIFALLFLIGALSLAAVSHSLYYALR